MTILLVRGCLGVHVRACVRVVTGFSGLGVADYGSVDGLRSIYSLRLWVRGLGFGIWGVGIRASSNARANSGSQTASVK